MKKQNKVLFGCVDVYFFGRCLGNDKVPETGNNPLGMESTHFFTQTLDINRKEVNTISVNGDCILENTLQDKQNTSTIIKERRSDDLDSVHSVLSIDYTSKSLQPMNPKQRIKCLKDAGVEMVKDQLWLDQGKCLMKIRYERQKVGCSCTGSNSCGSAKCACSTEGISCLSDGNRFPCKCGLKCANQSGKKVYSHFRIKYHYKHTFERDLLLQSSSDIFSEMTKYGDCRLCSEIDDDTLKQMFKNPFPRNRKRSNVEVKDKSIIDASKTKTIVTHERSPTWDICPPVESTVMTVSSILLPTFSHEELFAKTSFIDLIADVDKENVSSIGKSDQKNENSRISFISPTKTRSALAAITLPLDHWPLHIEEPLPPSIVDTDRSVAYFHYCLDEETRHSMLRSPPRLDRLARECIEQRMPMVDCVISSRDIVVPYKLCDDEKCLPSPVIELDCNIPETPKRKSHYKFRVSTTLRPLYFESPYVKIARRRRSGKLRQRLSGVLSHRVGGSIDISDQGDVYQLVRDIDAISLLEEVSDTAQCDSQDDF